MKRKMKPIQRTMIRPPDGHEALLCATLRRDYTGWDLSFNKGTEPGKTYDHSKGFKHKLKLTRDPSDAELCAWFDITPAELATDDWHDRWRQRERERMNQRSWQEHGMCYGDHYNETVKPPDLALFPDDTENAIFFGDAA